MRRRAAGAGTVLMLAGAMTMACSVTTAGRPVPADGETVLTYTVHYWW